jgi:hypothetical protein
MKKKILILLSGLVITGMTSLKASDSLRMISFNLYYANSGSGYGYSTNINACIESEGRSLEFGIIFQPVTSKVSGGEVLYKHYFSRPGSRENSLSGRIRTYMQYNFVFREAKMPDRVGFTESGTSETKGGRVATFEHYLALGLQFRIVNNIHVNSAIGYGISLGSVDEKYLDQSHYTEGGRRNIPSPAVKIGLGYTIVR